MALLNQSTKAASAAVQEIADSAGASADPEMLNRAWRSLNAATEHMQNVANWDFLITEYAAQFVFAPFNVGITAVSAQTSATVASNHGLLVGDMLIGGGINVDCRVTATGSNYIGLSVPTLVDFGTAATGISEQVIRDRYSVAADFKRMYDLRTYNNNATLRPMGRRFYDRSVVKDFVAGTPIGYDISPIPQYGQVQLVPPPANADTLGMRYYRRMYVATASADGTALDILQDYEPYMIAWAKWHFLTDKGDGRAAQAQTWLAFAENGIKKMISDQMRQPDEDLMFTPGHYTYAANWGPNSVRNALDGWGAN